MQQRLGVDVAKHDIAWTRAAALHIRNLTVEVGEGDKRALVVDDLSLSVEPGEMLGIVGESGSGKTMTALSVLRLLPAGARVAGGEIKLGDTQVLALSNRDMYRLRGSQVAMIFQDPMSALNPTRTIGWQIAEAVRTHLGLSRRASAARAREALKLVGMPDPEHHTSSYPHQLSGGMRQRALIAIALSCEPHLLIADEPTTALDVTIQAQILANLRDLRDRLGMGVILITHDLGLVVKYCDRVAVMYAGRIVETAPADLPLQEMRHRYTEALVAASPQGVTRDSGRLYNIPGAPPEPAPSRERCTFADRCQYVDQICREHRPPLIASTRPDHLFACYRPRSLEDAGAPFIRRSVAFSNSVEIGSDGAPMLEVEGVSKDFVVTSHHLLRHGGDKLSAVDDVSFEVQPGTTLGIVGESGCGKSTLARLIVALERPDKGRVTVGGVDLASLSGKRLRAARRDFQLVFQNAYAALDPRMRAEAILREPLAIQGIGTFAEQSARIRTAIEDVGLPLTALAKFPYELSGGQQQRLGLARALMLEPKLIVADEPVSSLDVSVQAQVLNLMIEVQRSRALTYVFISHDLGVVRYLSDMIGVMYLGRMVEFGQSEQVYFAPAHPYTRALIDAIPQLTGRGATTRPLEGELPSAINPPSGCRFRTRCPRAQAICAEIKPELIGRGTGRQAVACHFPLSAGAG